MVFIHFTLVYSKGCPANGAVSAAAAHDCSAASSGNACEGASRISLARRALANARAQSGASLLEARHKIAENRILGKNLYWCPLQLAAFRIAVEHPMTWTCLYGPTYIRVADLVDDRLTIAVQTIDGDGLRIQQTRNPEREAHECHVDL